MQSGIALFNRFRWLKTIIWVDSGHIEVVKSTFFTGFVASWCLFNLIKIYFIVWVKVKCTWNSKGLTCKRFLMKTASIKLWLISGTLEGTWMICNKVCKTLLRLLMCGSIQRYWGFKTAKIIRIICQFIGLYLLKDGYFEQKDLQNQSLHEVRLIFKQF